jgi:hypothetical protein
MSYAAALALTLTIEVPLYVGLAALTGRRPDSTGVLVAVGVNVVSHPLLWFALEPTIGFWAAEALVAAAEGAVAARVLRLSLADALAIAVVANGCSLLAGLLLLG